MSLILNRNKNNKKLGNLNLNKDLIEFKKTESIQMVEYIILIKKFLIIFEIIIPH